MEGKAEQAKCGDVEPAMLSIHFHARRQLDVRGAPAIALLPEVQPMPLEDALEMVREDGCRCREAAWTLIRSASPPRRAGAGRELSLRYGRALRDFAQKIDFDLSAYDSCREAYRRDARLFSSSLIAFSDGDFGTFDALRRGMDSREFGVATSETKALGGMMPEEYLESLATLPPSTPGRKRPEANTREAVARSIGRLEDEMGVGLERYLGEFVDMVAFKRLWGDRDGSRRVTVYPASTLAIQDVETLTTTVTATSFVWATDFSSMTRTMDPRRWPEYSNIFEQVRFVTVDDDLDVQPTDVGKVGAGLKEPGIVEERVRLLSSVGGPDIGRFHNLLSIDRFKVHKSRRHMNCFADLEFSLLRSLDSRFLWDTRPGGIVLDSGFIKVRCLTENLWRVTSRKRLRFTDRSAHPGSQGRLDFGQTLNYLAPAALTEWIESDMYSTEQPQVHEPGKRAKETA